MSGGQWLPASGTWQLALVYTHEMFRVRVTTRKMHSDDAMSAKGNRMLKEIVCLQIFFYLEAG